MFTEFTIAEMARFEHQRDLDKHTNLNAIKINDQ